MPAPVTINDQDRFLVAEPVDYTTDFPIGWPVFDAAGFAVAVDGAPRTDWSFIGAFDTTAVPSVCTTGVIRFPAPGVIGHVAIVGDYAPRRPNNFAEGVGIPARNFNSALNLLTAGLREIWEASKRSIRAAPGDPAVKPLPRGAFSFPDKTFVTDGAGGLKVQGAVTQESVNGLIDVISGAVIEQHLRAEIPLLSRRARLTQKTVACLKFTDAGGADLFLGASKAPQGCAGFLWRGQRYVLRAQRVTVDADAEPSAGSEYCRLMLYAHLEPGYGVELVPLGFSAAAFISGHQSCSVFLHADGYPRAVRGHSTGDAYAYRAKGVQVIKIDPLNPSVVTSIQDIKLLPLPGSGKARQLYYGATCGASDDGRYYFMICNHDAPVANRSDGVSTIFVWRRDLVDAAAAANAGDAAGVDPIAVKRLPMSEARDAEAVQDAHLRADGVLYVVTGSTMGQGVHCVIETNVFKPGEDAQVVQVDGARGEYTSAEVLNHPVYGVLTLESEGVFQYPDDPDTVYWLEQEVWFAAGDRVTYDGCTWVCKDANTGVRPGDERSWQLTSLAANQGAWSPFTAYAGSTAVTRRRTVLTKLFAATGAVGEKPLYSGKTGAPSPATVALTGNTADMSVQRGRSWQVFSHSTLSGVATLIMRFYQGGFAVGDDSPAGDPSKLGWFRRYRRVTGNGQRGRISLEDETGLQRYKSYDADDALFPNTTTLSHADGSIFVDGNAVDGLISDLGKATVKAFGVAAPALLRLDKRLALNPNVMDWAGAIFSDRLAAALAEVERGSTLNVPPARLGELDAQLEDASGTRYWRADRTFVVNSGTKLKGAGRGVRGTYIRTVGAGQAAKYSDRFLDDNLNLATRPLFLLSGQDVFLEDLQLGTGGTVEPAWETGIHVPSLYRCGFDMLDIQAGFNDGVLLDMTWAENNVRLKTRFPYITNTGAMNEFAGLRSRVRALRCVTLFGTVRDPLDMSTWGTDAWCWGGGGASDITFDMMILRVIGAAGACFWADAAVPNAAGVAQGIYFWNSRFAALAGQHALYLDRINRATFHGYSESNGFPNTGRVSFTQRTSSISLKGRFICPPYESTDGGATYTYLGGSTEAAFHTEFSVDNYNGNFSLGAVTSLGKGGLTAQAANLDVLKGRVGDLAIRHASSNTDKMTVTASGVTMTVPLVAAVDGGVGLGSSGSQFGQLSASGIRSYLATVFNTRAVGSMSWNPTNATTVMTLNSLTLGLGAGIGFTADAAYDIGSQSAVAKSVNADALYRKPRTRQTLPTPAAGLAGNEYRVTNPEADGAVTHGAIVVSTGAGGYVYAKDGAAVSLV